MKLESTANIWHNGRVIPWDDANIQVLSHIIHCGSSIFDGIRCYSQAMQGEDAVPGAAIFRLHEHTRRFLDSAQIYRMPIPFTAPELSTAVIDLIETNGVCHCYIRPIALRGYGEFGANPIHCPVEVYKANFPGGKYFSGRQGADVCVSSWNRLAPNTMPSLAKAGAKYMNSQLVRLEAEFNGISEGIAHDAKIQPPGGHRAPRRPHAAGEVVRSSEQNPTAKGMGGMDPEASPTNDPSRGGDNARKLFS
jgi:branched-chain amino acid aminotransferase